MASTGPNYPSTASGWTNSSNVGASDGVYASTSVGGSSNSAVLTATAFGFSIPAGSTIDGVYVEVRRQGASLAHSDQSVRLVIGGSAAGDNKAKSGTWSTSDTTQTYGGAADKWGLTPSDSDINASNFGLAFQCKNALGGSRTAYVDFIRITVYYTAAAGVAKQMHQLRQQGIA